jgi:hypothetical protein
MSLYHKLVQMQKREVPNKEQMIESNGGVSEVLYQLCPVPN